MGADAVGANGLGVEPRDRILTAEDTESSHFFSPTYAGGAPAWDAIAVVPYRSRKRGVGSRPRQGRSLMLIVARLSLPWTVL
jgi:hypothetical protein